MHERNGQESHVPVFESACENYQNDFARNHDSVVCRVTLGEEPKAGESPPAHYFVGADMKNGSSTFQSESRKGRNEKRKETEYENDRQ